MKKMNLKKAFAGVAALSLVACTAAIGASAAEGDITVTIGHQDFDTVEALKAADTDTATAGYQIPIYVELTKNAGISAFEFGVAADNGAVFAFDDENDELEGKLCPDGIAPRVGEKTDAKGWLAFAATKTVSKTGKIVMMVVTVPETAKAGDVYNLTYLKQSNERTEKWADVTGAEAVNYVESSSVASVDGWIKIAAAPATDTTPATDPVPATDTTPATADPATDPAPATSAPATNAPATSAPATGTSASTTGTSSTSSPQTGTTDVLPIVGVAAAVAVLGGVAIVSKKKND